MAMTYSSTGKSLRVNNSGKFTDELSKGDVLRIFTSEGNFSVDFELSGRAQIIEDLKKAGRLKQMSKLPEGDGK